MPHCRPTSSEKVLLEAIENDNDARKRAVTPGRRMGKPIRPTSAQAKLQSRGTPNVLEETRPATAAAGSRGLGHAGFTPSSSRGQVSQTTSAWGTRVNDDIPKIETQVRRLTLGVVDGLAEKADSAITRSRQTAHSAPVTKIEERINLEHLNKLKHSFETVDTENSGTLTLDQFKSVIRSSLGLRGRNDEQITALFMKIDSNSEGYIEWDQFCTYMQLEYEEKEDAYRRQKDVEIHTPANLENMPHREPVLRITNMSDGTFVATSQDGTISFWNGNMELKRTKSVMTEQNATRQKPKWVTDFVLMPQYNKFILGTGDREIQFYELSTFEPYCQVTGLETTPLKITYCATGYDECLIMYGDSEGCINIIIINGTGETLRTWKKMPKTEGIASVTLEKVAHSPLTRFVRWKVHNDWVAELRYYDEIRSIISCSNNESTALVIGCTTGSTHVEAQLKEIKEHSNFPDAADKKMKLAQQNYANAKRRLEADQTTFRIHKGVKIFDFCKEKNLIITGGMDRIVRMWNPYVPSKPTGMLRGHNAPIFALFIAPDENRIYSISQDKTIKVWDIKDQVCMLTIRPKTHKVRGDLQACHYNRVAKGFAIATDQMALLSHRSNRTQQNGEVAYSHKEPVQCAKFNPSFKHIVSCSDGSVVKIWDFETGNAVFEFSQAHDNSAITAMTFDTSNRRLITGGRDGRLKIWNYNNGHCLKRLEREDDFDEITDVTYIEMNKNRFIISVGWDRHINMYTDNSEDFRHVQHPLPKWTDDLRDGHREDILSVAVCLPSLLATSSYDGEVIVWNIISGHIYCHLRSPVPKDYVAEELDGDNSICKLLFLATRKDNKSAAQLIASGPRGSIHFWNVYNGGVLFAQFSSSKNSSAPVTTMQLTDDDSTLFAGDSRGFVTAWDVEGYCQFGKEDIPPPVLGSWRAHIESITSMNLIQAHNVLITSSLDCTVRLWTTEGHYVGTLGQQQPWDIYNPSTFGHPMVPYDVLVDPVSMPSHPMMELKVANGDFEEEEEEDQDDRGEESPEKEAEKEERKSDIISVSTYTSKTEFHYDDDMIAKELKQKPFNKGTGKRLRHEKLKPNPKDRGGPNAYQNLKCFELDDTPPISPPTRSREKNDDPFGFQF
ncbi:WD repeat-containing protein on Y chromosome-like isoform X1 [Acanthaster planci]|uniref:WD repeat-containing protein on Y chromosome-like isoform X1 n=1 Tax=Acanthaster planci TaxID=133434 RepID=A0A8B7Y3C8_ACAPL|nr:WD repeat-containing protein on Y chromosome-like isoform X1 [Acanthaster planci]